MSQPHTYERFHDRARAYFDRPSLVMPVWRDANSLLVLDDRSGTMQVASVDPAAGTVTPVTAYPERVQSVKAHAASGTVLFGMDTGGNERQQLYRLALDNSVARLTTNDDAIFEPGCFSADGREVLVRSNQRDYGTFDIISIDTLTGDISMWLENGEQVTPLAMSPDGTSALIHKFRGNQDAALLLVSRDGTVTNLMPSTDEQAIVDASFEDNGREAWLLTNAGREFLALIRIDLESRQQEVIVEAAWDVEQYAVSPDGTTLAVVVNVDGSSTLELRALTDGTVTPVDLPMGVIDHLAWSPDSTRLAFGFSTIESPSALMIASRDGRLTRIDAGSGSVPTRPAEVIRYPSFDGLAIPAFWLTPEGEGPWPVLVDIHGGPEGQRRPDYRPSGPVIQYILSLGIAVLSLNVRGSAGFGKTYIHLDDTDKRMDSVHDVERAVAWLRQRDDVIADKIAVYGRSYGGFMVLASLVEYPELFAAGVEFVGIANFVTFLERTSAWRRSHREAEYGSLEHDREMLQAISPMTRIDRITAPLMVCHGRNDVRVPLHETEQVVAAVKANGQDVLFRIYDDEGHAMTRLPNTLDAFAHMGQFLTKHVLS